MAEETDFLATHYLEICTFVNEYMKRLTMSASKVLFTQFTTHHKNINNKKWSQY